MSGRSGAVATLVVPPQADQPLKHAEVRVGNGLVMIDDADRTDSPFALPGPVVLYAAVYDPHALHDRAVTGGAEIVMELTDQDYGSREFAARDPHGNVWCFGTYRPGAGLAPIPAVRRCSANTATAQGTDEDDHRRAENDEFEHRCSFLTSRLLHTREVILGMYDYTSPK